LLLLITCGNLATLLLARASARRREIAVRAAIGASRWRLVSQMLVESLLVSAGGALVALPVAVASSTALVAFLSTTLNPVDLTLGIDWRLVGFLGAMAVLTAMAFGIIPAFRLSIVSPMSAMTIASRGASVDRHRAWFERGLVAAQVAVSLVLVVSALMFVQTFRNLGTVETGFRQDDTMFVAFWDFAAQDLEPEQIHAFQEQLTDAIRSVPGVVSAASTQHIPLSGSTFSHLFRVTDGTERKAARFSYVGAAYFSTLGVPVRAGRSFTEQDRTGSRAVAVVNESFVRAHLNGREPVGAMIRTMEEPKYPETTYEIVGVVGDTTYADLRGENCWCDADEVSMPPIAYLPLPQHPSPYAWSPVIIRFSAPLSAVTPAIAERVTALNPRIAFMATDMRSHIGQRLTAERLIAWLAGAFGVLATVLVVVGLYGLIAYLTTGRRNEIGVRLSLGSTRAQIVLLVMRDALLMVGVGVLVGLPLAGGLTRQAAALLFGVSATDLLTLAGAALLLATAALVAGGIPARRASQLDPVVVLRAE
jgi:predicted permease